MLGQPIRLDDESRNILELPASGLVSKVRRAYLRYPDGTRESVKERRLLRLAAREDRLRP